MHLHVSCNARFAEALPTDRTQVLGAVVRSLMLFEGIITQESLVALAADEYASSLVDPLVLVIA